MSKRRFTLASPFGTSSIPEDTVLEDAPQGGPSRPLRSTASSRTVPRPSTQSSTRPRILNMPTTNPPPRTRSHTVSVSMGQPRGSIDSGRRQSQPRASRDQGKRRSGAAEADEYPDIEPARYEVGGKGELQDDVVGVLDVVDGEVSTGKSICDLGSELGLRRSEPSPKHDQLDCFPAHTATMVPET